MCAPHHAPTIHHTRTTHRDFITVTAEHITNKIIHKKMDDEVYDEDDLAQLMADGELGSEIASLGTLGWQFGNFGGVGGLFGGGAKGEGTKI